MTGDCIVGGVTGIHVLFIFQQQRSVLFDAVEGKVLLNGRSRAVSRGVISNYHSVVGVVLSKNGVEVLLHSEVFVAVETVDNYTDGQFLVLSDAVGHLHPFVLLSEDSFLLDVLIVVQLDVVLALGVSLRSFAVLKQLSSSLDCLFPFLQLLLIVKHVLQLLSLRVLCL